MKIDFLIADNPYGSTVHFAKGLAQALERRGVQIRLHWIAEGQYFHAFDVITQDPPDLTCSFSDVHINRQPIGDLWQIPHLSLLVDPAIYFLHQLRGDFSWVSCVDLGDVEFIRSLNFERVFYLPHAGDRALLTTPSKERPYEVVFFGSCSEAIADDEIVEAASRRVLSPEDVSILQALVELRVPDEKLPEYHMRVDLYTRFKDRVELLCALKNHQVHIWGSGPWKKYVPHSVVHQAVTFDKALGIMQKAKVVVNSSPRFKQGLHERIISGALCGAAVLSANGGGYTYRYGEWEDCQFDDWEEVAAQKQAEVVAEHTWDARAETLLNNVFNLTSTSERDCNKRQNSI